MYICSFYGHAYTGIIVHHMHTVTDIGTLSWYVQILQRNAPQEDWPCLVDDDVHVGTIVHQPPK